MLGLAAPAIAGDGQISDRSLTKFGLAGMKTISDTEGLKIRGQSFVIAGSFTSVNGHVTSNFSFTNGIPAHTFQFGAGVAAGGFAVATPLIESAAIETGPTVLLSVDKYNR